MTPELSVIQMLDKVLEWFTKDYKDLGMDNPIPRQSVPVEWVRQNLEKIYPELNTQGQGYFFQIPGICFL